MIERILNISGIMNIPKLAIAAFVTAGSVCGCFRDKGNYDYIEVNEAIISDHGFTEKYDVRLNESTLDIVPEITFTKDSEGKGDYGYEWVAVGQNFYRGQRFTIGTERELHYPVRLAAEEYILYFKVTDKSTDLVFSKSVGLNVRSLYSTGWLLGGEEPDGSGQVDMISFSAQTKYLTRTLNFKDGLETGPVSLVWIDNDEWTSENRLYVSTDRGTFKFDRESFTGSPYTSLVHSFVLPPEGDCVMTDSQKISDKRHVVIVDSRAYVVSSDGGMIGNTFSVTAEGQECETAPKMMCNHKSRDIRMFIFLDSVRKRFCYISGLTVKEFIPLPDSEGDAYSYDTTKDFPHGLDMVTAVNSFFGSGQSAAIMKNPDDGSVWIYCMTANNAGTYGKEGRYKADLSVATEFDRAQHIVMTTNHGYLIYSVENRLYGFNFRSTPQTCVLLETFNAPVTCLKADNETDEKYNDIFFVATYDDSSPRSGILYKYKVTDSPDETEITRLESFDKGFLKIHSICYKHF